MTSWIDENTIANLYSALREMNVFSEYKLPPASQVDFVIVHDDSMCGQYEPPEKGEPHIITISTARHSHLYPVLMTLCHEIIHMIVYMTSKKTDQYTSHKGLFLKLQKRVAKMYGFDPKEL
jgi:hypothetical protein